MNTHTTTDTSNAAISMHLLTGSSSLTSGENVQLSFKPVNHHEPFAIVPLAVQHESAFHLIVLSEDLRLFQHLHPELQPDGTYNVTLTFPVGGDYLLVADYQPVGHAPIVDKIPVQVKGGNTGKPVEDTTETLVSVADGFRVSIEATLPFLSGAHSLIPIRIERDNKAVTAADITPYLGAVAHMILVSKTDKDFLHIHPEAGTDYPVVGHTLFSKPDIYRMWVQFQVGDHLHTADFTLDVKQGTSHHEHADAHAHHHHH